MSTKFKTSHDLLFMQGERYLRVNDDNAPFMFRVGTCHGLWYSKRSAHVLLAIFNDEPGNGHFDDVMEWFTHACKRDKRDFIVEAVWNGRLRKHLIEKRGFKEIPCTDSLIKEWKDL